ncbi:MAG: metal-sensitive transcriptional regulator [Acidobacteriota bacterium]
MANLKNAETQNMEMLGKLERVYLDDQAQKALSNRLARLEGHLRSVRGMVQDHRCADEILLQLAAVKAGLNQFAAALLDHELRACMNTCMGGDAGERLDKITKVLSTLLKHS